MINETITLTGEQLLQAHSQQTMPFLVLFYIISSLLFIAVGLLSVKKSHSKIFLIWIISTILTGLLLLVFYLFPASIESFLNLFSN